MLKPLSNMRILLLLEPCVKNTSHRPRLSHRPHMSHMPRLRRRGMGLLDAILGLILFAAMASMAAQMWTAQLEKIARDVEARNLWEVKSALKDYVEADIPARYTAAVAAGGALEITPTMLSAANITLRNGALYGLERRPIDMWVIQDGSDLIYFARASGALKSPHYPAANVIYGPMGSVSGEQPGKVQGPALDWDVASLQIAHGLPLLNDVLAVEFVSIAADYRPYLSRTGAVTSAGVNLSSMTSNLDLGGQNLINVNDVTAAGALTADTLNVGTLAITGAMSGADLQISDTASVAGTLTAGQINSLEAITAGSVSINGPLDASSLNISGAATFGTLTITGEMDIGGDLNAVSATVENIEANSILATGASGVALDTATFDQIITGSCSGC